MKFEMVKATAKKLFDIVRFHWLIIVSGLVLTTIVSAPLFLFPLMNRDVYAGINHANFGRDQLFYLSRGKDVLQGHHLGNAVLREGKEGQEMHVSYIEYVILAPFKILGVVETADIVAIYNVYNFVGVFILILLIYGASLQLSQSRLLAAASATGIIAGYPIIFFKTLFHPEVLYYGRAFSPYLIAIPFFIFLNFLIKSLRSNSVRYAVFAGIAFGALFYAYFFAWTFAGSLCGLLAIIFALKKDWRQFKKTLFTLGIGLALGAYNVAYMLSFHFSPEGRQLFYFLWSEHTRAPTFSGVGFAALALFTAYFYKNRRTDANVPLIAALILSGWVVLNQQIIIGTVTQPAHYYWFFIVPISILTGLYMLWKLLVARDRLRVALFSGLICLFLISGAVGQYRAEVNAAPFKRAEQAFRPLLDFLNADRSPGVILANDEDTSYLYTVYTNHDVFWNSTAAVNFNTPLERMNHALFVYVYLNKTARGNFAGFINSIMDNPQKDLLSLYREPYKAIEGYSSGLDFFDYQSAVATRDEGVRQHREATIAELDREYKQLSADSRNVERLLQRYGVNYVVWDKEKNPEWDFSFIRNQEKVFSQGNFEIYKIYY